MTFSTLKTHLKALPCGKKLNHSVYIIEESLAKVDETTGTIGFKLNWEKLLNEKGLSYQEHRLIEPQSTNLSEIETTPVIDRHKTAISRYNFSKPVQSILEYNLLEETMSFFDYGCGLGDDLRGLSALGYTCSGWDPVHKKDSKKTSSHVVKVGFVLNVIENPEERIEVLHDAYNLTKKLMVVTTLFTNDITAVNPTPYKDGYLTNRDTFQKYYEQSELQQFIEDTLNTSVMPASSGIFYIFKDPVSAQNC
ncbi:MAG: DNA phosphorothioation-associated putative methyltransferase [Spirochaetales bacterium]|nr:DNA phosphorothioation-associated putative methyltransferase [Spirochaetales bacterium]